MVTVTDGRMGFFNVVGPELCLLKYIEGGFGVGDAGLVSLNESIDSSSAASPLAFAIS